VTAPDTAHFGLVSKEGEWNHVRVSGRSNGVQLKRVIEETHPNCLIPIHTEHEEYHKKRHNNVGIVELNQTIGL
jgi:mRNA degradation ribonuclease J1/J2